MTEEKWLESADGEVGLRATGQVVNIGSGVETPVVELARHILRSFDLPESRLSFEEPRAWDRVVRRCASVERLRALFDFVPATPLGEGLRQAAGWLHAAGYLDRAPA